MEFRVLGPVVVADGAQTVDIGTPRQRALLARLLVDVGRVVSLDRIIEDLWGEEPPATATATLQSYVSHLRRALEPDRAPRAPSTVLVTQPPGYVLHVDPESLDAACFAADVDRGRELLDAGRPGDAERAFDDALARWRGEPFADVQFEAFAEVERRRLHELHDSAVEDRFSALLDQGRHRYALGDLEAYVSGHPYRERAWELLMLARYRSGQQVDALRAFQDARSALVEQVGVEPGPRLVELERMVVNQDPGLAWRPPASRLAPGEGARPPAARPQAAPSGPPTAMGANASGDAAPAPAGVVEGPSGPSGRAPLVGREAPLAVLAGEVARLRGGVGGLALVVGEAGIGKTRLVEEALAAEPDLRVVWGRASDGDGSPGYWPWTQALGRLVAVSDDATVAVGGPLLGHVVPEVAERLGPPPELPHDDGGARFVVQRAVAAFLGAVCQWGPTVLVLDDAHWADGSSLRLLASLAPQLAQLPLLVVATFRPREGRENAALGEALASAAREVGVERVELGGLDRTAVARHLESAGIDPSGRLAEVVHSRSGGNPFFVTELGRLLVSRGVEGEPLEQRAATLVPHAVRDVMGQRLARLPEPTVDCLALAATAGRVSDIGVLALAADLDADVVMDRIEPAVLAGLVVLDPDTPGSLRFAHDLVRDAVHDELPPARQLRLHRRVGQALVDRYGDAATERAHEIAVHLAEAFPLGTAPDVRHWAVEAARLAARRAADDEAVGAWRLALQAHDLARPGDIDGRYDILLELGLALRRAWDLDGARQAIDQALDLALAAEDPHRIAEAASVYGGVNLWTWRQIGEVDERVVGALTWALERLDEEVSVTRIRALGSLGVELYYSPRREQAEQLTTEAVACAERLGDPAELARALNNSFIVRWLPGREEELVGLTDRMLALPDLSPDVEAIASMHRVMLLDTLGHVEEAAVTMERLAELRSLVRMPDVTAQIDLALSTWDLLLGDLDAAAGHLERAWRTRYQESSMWGGEWVYRVGRLELDPTLEEVELGGERLAELCRGERYDLQRPTAILLLARAGRTDDARALVDDGPHLFECWTSLFNLAQWAAITVELDLPGGEDLYRQLEPYAEGLVVAGSNLTCWGSTHGLLGQLALHLGDRERGLDHLRRAVERHVELGLPVLEARSRARLERAEGRA